MTAPKIYKISLPAPAVELVLHALNKLPREQVNDLWMDIYNQCVAANEPKHGTDAESLSPGLSD